MNVFDENELKCGRHQCLKKILPPLAQLFNLARTLHEHMDSLESMLLSPFPPMLLYLFSISSDEYLK